MHLSGKLWSPKKKKPITRSIVCLLSFAQLLCFIFIIHTLSNAWTCNARYQSAPHPTPHWKKSTESQLSCSQAECPLLLGWCHPSVLWFSDAYQDLFHSDTLRPIPGTWKLCCFSQHSQGSDVAQIKSCPPDLCVFWPKVEVHISMAGMCWVLWIRLLCGAVLRIFVIKLHFSNQTQPPAIVLKAGRALLGVTAFKITSSSSWHWISFRKKKGSQ